MPPVIEPPSFVPARMPRNPERRTSWKNGAERANRQFNAGPDVDARRAKRRIEISAAAEGRRIHRALNRKHRFCAGGGIATGTDLFDEADSVYICTMPNPQQGYITIVD